MIYTVADEKARVRVGAIPRPQCCRRPEVPVPVGAVLFTEEAILRFFFPTAAGPALPVSVVTFLTSSRVVPAAEVGAGSAVTPTSGTGSILLKEDCWLLPERTDESSVERLLPLETGGVDLCLGAAVIRRRKVPEQEKRPFYHPNGRYPAWKKVRVALAVQKHETSENLILFAFVDRHSNASFHSPADQKSHLGLESLGVVQNYSHCREMKRRVLATLARATAGAMAMAIDRQDKRSAAYIITLPFLCTRPSRQSQVQSLCGRASL